MNDNNDIVVSVGEFEVRYLDALELAKVRGSVPIIENRYEHYVNVSAAIFAARVSRVKNDLTADQKRTIYIRHQAKAEAVLAEADKKTAKLLDDELENLLHGVDGTIHPDE